MMSDLTGARASPEGRAGKKALAVNFNAVCLGLYRTGARPVQSVSLELKLKVDLAEVVIGPETKATRSARGRTLPRRRPSIWLPTTCLQIAATCPTPRP